MKNTASFKPLSSVTYWNHLVRYSVEQNLNLDAVIKQYAPESDKDFMPFEDLKALIKAISDASDKAWVGLDVAQNLQLSSHGNLGFAVTHGLNLKECLVLIMNYYQTRMQALDIDSSIHNDAYIVTVTPACDWEPVSNILHEVFALTLMNVLEYIIGNEVKSCKFNFPYSKPEWFYKYEALIPCEVSFGHAAASVNIPIALLDIPCLSSNARSVDFAKNQCDIELSRVAHYETIAEKISSLIESNNRYGITAEVAAKHLNMSKSTLTRKLKGEGTTFKLILDNMRKQRASDLLLTSELTVDTIAFELGYEDHSNFGRSFKRWYGCTPSFYRQTEQ